MGFWKPNSYVIKHNLDELIFYLFEFILFIIFAMKGFIEQLDKLNQTVFVHWIQFFETTKCYVQCCSFLG